MNHTCDCQVMPVCHRESLGRVGGLRFSPGAPGWNGVAGS